MSTRRPSLFTGIITTISKGYPIAFFFSSIVPANSCFSINYPKPHLHRAEIGPSQLPIGDPVRRDRYFATTSTVTKPIHIVFNSSNRRCTPASASILFFQLGALVVLPLACDNETNHLPSILVYYTARTLLLLFGLMF